MHLHISRYKTQDCIKDDKIYDKITRLSKNKLCGIKKIPHFEKILKNRLIKLYDSINNIILYNYPIVYEDNNKAILGYLDIVTYENDIYNIYIFTEKYKTNLLIGFVALCFLSEFKKSNCIINIVNINTGLVKSYSNIKHYVELFLNNKNKIQFCKGCEHCKYDKIINRFNK